MLLNEVENKNPDKCVFIPVPSEKDANKTDQKSKISSDKENFFDKKQLEFAANTANKSLGVTKKLLISH